jgi:hypothetical protein
MKTLTCIFLLSLAGCGLPAPTYTTQYGTDVYEGEAPGTLPQPAAEAMQTWLRNEVPALGGVYTQDCLDYGLSQAYFYLRAKPWPCEESPTGLCAGSDGSGDVIDLLQARDGDPYHTAFLHELGHLAQYHCHSAYDPDLEHKEMKLWKLLETAQF